MGGLREGLGRQGYRSVTHPEARPGPDDLGALLAAIPFSSDRAVLAPYRGFRAIRLRQSAEDHAIGNVVAGVGLPALVLERHLDGKLDCPAGTGRRDPQAWRPLPAALWPAQPGRRRPTALLCTNFGRRIYQRADRLAVLAGPGQRVPVDAVPLGKGPACAASRLPAPAHRRGRARADQRGCTGAATGRGNVRRCVPARCCRTVWRTIAVTICPGNSGHK